MCRRRVRTEPSAPVESWTIVDQKPTVDEPIARGAPPLLVRDGGQVLRMPPPSSRHAAAPFTLSPPPDDAQQDEVGAAAAGARHDAGVPVVHADRYQELLGAHGARKTHFLAHLVLLLSITATSLYRRHASSVRDECEASDERGGRVASVRRADSPHWRCHASRLPNMPQAECGHDHPAHEDPASTPAAPVPPRCRRRSAGRSFVKPRREPRTITVTRRPSPWHPPAPRAKTARRGHPKLGPSGPVSAKPTHAGPPAATPAHSALTVRLACEACSEELLVAFPPGRARYGAIDCPSCGSDPLPPGVRDGGRALPFASFG